MSAIRPLRLLVPLAFLLAATLLLAAASAEAHDTFTFQGPAGVEFRNYDEATNSPWQAEAEDQCWVGRTGNLVEEQSGSEGSIHAFPETRPATCPERWTAYMGYRQGRYTFGGILFRPWVLEGSWSTVQCIIPDLESELFDELFPASIEMLMSAEADGTTCIVEWLPGKGSGSALARAASLAPAGWHSRMVDSLARVAGGTAKVRVEIFGSGKRTVRDRVTLRTRGGRLIGSATGAGHTAAGPRTIAVPLAPFAQRALAQKGELMVRARLRHADGTPGTGDRTRQLVLRATG